MVYRGGAEDAERNAENHLCVLCVSAVKSFRDDLIDFMAAIG